MFRLTFGVTVVLAITGASLSARAQDSGDGDRIALELGEIVVVGTRVRGVAAEDLPVPVDVYDIDEVAGAGTADLAVALQKVAPSFNSKRNALGDGGLFHTAVLRGMSPDHTLVLINGKRRHSISFPRPLEQVGEGTTGADLRAIPIAAIERIEVLRDGAASRYGSDAIGGVINIVLKENPDESTADLYAGVTQEGDGGRFGASANLGLPLGATGGAVNLTVEAFDQGRTDRSFDTSRLDAGGAHDPAIGRQSVLGEPEYDTLAVFLNAAMPVADDAGEFYVFGGWSSRNGLSSGAWRDPVWAQDRMVRPVHPDGFVPFEESTSEDHAATAGLRSVLGEWDADISLSYGANIFDFGATDSINASWAAAWLQGQLDSGRALADISPAEVVANSGPRSGDSGGTELESWSIDADVSGELPVGTRTVDAAFGAELRRESFRIRAGDFASWGCGTPDAPGVEAPAVTLDEDGNVAQLDGQRARCGHQGYPGYSPVNERFGERDRTSHAVWADFRHDMTDAWNVETALRWERYQGAGNSVTGMAGSRYDVSPAVSFRAAASTGFRAPSLPQLGFNTIIFEGGGDEGLSVTAHLEDGAANRFFGVGPADLAHETSHNVSAGVVWTPRSDISVSIDLYRIDLADRITLSNYTPDCADADAAGCAAMTAERGLPRVTNVQYYDNSVDTRTTGLDVVASHDRAFLDGELTLTGALHFNRTKITSGRDRVAGVTQSFIKEGNPRQKHRVAADWTNGRSLDLHLGLNYFGKTAPQWLGLENVVPDCPGKISPAWIADAEAGLRVGILRFGVGVNNLFDEYPDKLNDACSAFVDGILGWGLPYSPDTSYGLSGRILYARLSARF